MNPNKHIPLLTLIILPALGFASLFLPSDSLAAGSLQDIITEYQSERYVILEKLKCSNNEVIERYVRIYEKSSQKDIKGNVEEKIVTKGRELTQDENSLAYLLENYINIEGTYYRPSLEALSDRYVVDGSTCPDTGYKISTWDFDLERKTAKEIQNRRFPISLKSLPLRPAAKPSQNLYQVTRYSFNGFDFGSEVTIADSEYVPQEKNQPNIVKTYSAMADIDQIANTYEIKVDRFAYKAGKLINQYQLGKEQSLMASTSPTRTINKKVSIYQLDKKPCYELGDCFLKKLSYYKKVIQ